MPMPGEKQAEEYKRSFARQNDTLSQTQLPVFVFDHVLQKRFNRDISTFDAAEMEIAGRDLRVYILLLNYIFGMREAGRSLIEFDIFDVENSTQSSNESKRRKRNRNKNSGPQYSE